MKTKETDMRPFTKLRRSLIRWLAGSMPVALNVRVMPNGHLDMGPSASLSDNNRWPE